MNLAMAICTVHADFESSASRVGIIVIQEIPDMPTTTACSYICMALLAQLRPLFVK
jgi:hypothetical protein